MIITCIVLCDLSAIIIIIISSNTTIIVIFYFTITDLKWMAFKYFCFVYVNFVRLHVCVGQEQTL